MKDLKQFKKEFDQTFNEVWSKTDSYFIEGKGEVNEPLLIKKNQDIKNFFTNYLKELKKEIAGEECSLKGEKDITDINYEQGYNTKRQQDLDIFTNLGI